MAPSPEPESPEIVTENYQGPDRRQLRLTSGIFPWSSIAYFIIGVGIIVSLGVASANYGEVRDRAEDNQAALERVLEVNNELRRIADFNCLRNRDQDHAMRRFIDGLSAVKTIRRSPQVLAQLDASRNLFDPDVSCP